MTEITPILPKDFTQGEHAFLTFNVTTSGLSAKDLTNPRLWTHVATKLRPGFEIRVIADDFSFIARLLVTFVRGTDVRTELFFHKTLGKIVSEKAREKAKEKVIAKIPPGLVRMVEEYKVVMRGPERWCVVKITDGSVVEKDIPTKAEAESSLLAYVTKLAAA